MVSRFLCLSPSRSMTTDGSDAAETKSDYYTAITTERKYLTTQLPTRNSFITTIYNKHTNYSSNITPFCFVEIFFHNI